MSRWLVAHFWSTRYTARTMSQPTRDIASYFNKSSPVKAPSSPATSRAGPSSLKSSPLQAAAVSTTNAATAAEAPGGSVAASTVTSSPSAPGSAAGVKRSFLSDAARQAIANGAKEAEEDQLSKKAKVISGNAAPVADVFLKAAQPVVPAPAVKMGKATTLEELRATLANHPRAASVTQLELDTMGEDWLLALQDELTKPYFLSLKEFVTKEQSTKRVFPPAADIYSWSRLCPLKDVRVVIIGQDPYHDDGQAHGLAFSVRKGMRIPPSLRNIYKEMSDEIPGFTIPKHGDLTEWAKHGVLLLNTSLTVRAHEAASHSGKGWEQFTAAVLKVVTNRLAPNAGDKVAGANGVVFMAWGAHAQKMCAGVSSAKHLILKSAHPSPLAAAKGFFGNGHFKQANHWLEKRYGPGGEVDWKVLCKE